MQEGPEPIANSGFWPVRTRTSHTCRYPKPVLQIVRMLKTASFRDDHITSLAIRLKRNQLSADDFQRELAALNRQQRATLVEYLDHIEKGPVEVIPQRQSTAESYA